MAAAVLTAPPGWRAAEGQEFQDFCVSRQMGEVVDHVKGSVEERMMEDTMNNGIRVSGN